ncbi:MAG: efflux RND transporter periplasmic adaptor subunit [Rubripirellula sp.]
MLDPSILISPTTPAVGHGLPIAPGVGADAVVDMRKQTRVLAMTIELLSKLDAHETLESATDALTHLLRQCLSAEQVIVMWRKRTDAGLSVMASAVEITENDHDPIRRLAIAAGEEVSARREFTCWPADSETSASQRHAMMAVVQFAKSVSAESMHGVCLSDESGHDCGVILCSNAKSESASRILKVLTSPLASKLSSIERLQPSSLDRSLKAFRSTAGRAKRRIAIGMAVGATVLMMLPLSYTIRADIELQPVQQRYVAAPFDGPLESAHVRPGDIVRKGDLLAKINPREVEYELASIRAELNQSVQEKKGMMASHDFAGSKIASLESERLQLQTQLLQFRHDNLEIRSPIDGVVVSGDLKQSEGTPLSRGEAMFEIAPLDQMIVEIAIPETDVIHVREGMAVRFHVDALPNTNLDAKILRVHPRAELKHHDNVFIAEVLIDNPENTMRPGMRGVARIAGDRHTLGWNLFHKAYFTLCRTVGW